MTDPKGEGVKVGFDGSLRLEFHGAKVTSDAGLLAYRDLDEALGLFDSVPFVFHDSRTGRNIQHHLTALLRQSVYSRLAGYEDVNDAHRLSVDPTMRRITGKKLDDKNAASANTMGRFETKMLSVEDNLKALSEVNGRWVERALQKTTHRRIILDMDSSASPVHGEQEASAYNGHFGCTCYHPLFCFNQFGDCEGSLLRPGNVQGVYRSFCNFGKGELKDQRSGAGFLQKLKARARRIRMAPDPKDRLPRELLKELIEEGSEAFRGVLEKLFNTAMQMEREEFLGARRWERSEQRRDHANGYKDKTLSTRVGQLRIRIPQVRHLDFYPRSLERGCRSEKALKLAIAEMYVMGVSTRKVTEITEQLCGTEISASQVSRISKLLDDELEQFRNRPLGSYPVVYLDAHYEKVRRQGSIQDVAVLKATGVNCWGKREVIGISCRLSEAEVHWREFLQQLQKRGLEGVQLIVSDDHSGLRAARRAVFPSVPWQRCQFHLSQNAQRYARRSDQRAAIATDIRDIFNAPSGGEAEAMLRTRVEQYRDRNPELADWMETNLPEGFTVFRFARSTWRRIRTNNGLENLNRQIRRRTRVVGIFPNTESALRLITAVVEEIHEDWLIGKQYLSLVDFNPQENPVSDRSQSNYRKTVA